MSLAEVYKYNLKIHVSNILGTNYLEQMYQTQLKHEPFNAIDKICMHMNFLKILKR